MNNLIRLIGRRLVALPIMIIGVTILVFFVTALSPIDQAYTVLGENATVAQVEAYREANGLNDPIVVQYFTYMGNLLHGDLGVYGATKASVADKIGQALPVTLELTFAGLVIALVFSTILGVVSAVYRDKWPDQIIRVFSIASLSMPSFWLAVLLILAFMGVLPVSGNLPDFFQDPAGWCARMALPAISLAVPVIGQMTRVIRTSMVEELDKGYVRTAIGAGIPKRTVIAKNVLRPLLSGLLMGACSYGLWLLLTTLGVDSRLLLCGLPVAAGGVTYAAAIVLLKVIRREDCLLLPKGEKIARILRL